jgi:hypothetical protein
MISLFCVLPVQPSRAAESQPESAGATENAPGKTGAPVAYPVEISPASSLTSSPATGGMEFVWELDPYYSEVSVHFPLTDAPIAEITGSNEFEVYRKLFIDSLIPRYILVEAAVFPMPLLGVALKEYQRDFYRGFNVGSSDFNLIEAVTAGFQEPYSLSVLLGDMVSFVKPGEQKVSSNKGYMGYMFSYSNLHIKQNTLIPDHSMEIEWKMKGERNYREDKLSWSFRIGSKLHSNPDISDTLYAGIRRQSLDFSADYLSFLKNGTIDFRWDFSKKDGRILRQEYVIGKKFPIKKWGVALKFDVGVIWEDATMYSGALRSTDHENVTAVIRPNIEF